MKLYIKCSKYSELPYGNMRQPLHPKNTKDPNEIEQVLFNTPDGLTQLNVHDAINNPNTAISTLVKLAPYAEWERKDPTFLAYIDNDRTPNDIKAKLITSAVPKIVEAIESGDIKDYEIGVKLMVMNELKDELKLSNEIKDTIEYYADNYSQILSSKAKQKLAAKRAKIKGDLPEDFTNNELIAFLSINNIDTSIAQYELVAEEYERYGSGNIYKKKFKCAGDYLAYFAMYFHRTPNANTLVEYYGGEKFKDIVAKYPTVDNISDYAAKNWWGDGDDGIISLKNLTTNEILYQNQNEEYHEYDEEDDWE